MLTFFTTLKPFTKPLVSTIQRNALESWIRLRPKCEVIVVGNDEGVREATKKLGIVHIPKVATNKGLPLIRDLFHQAQKKAKFPLLCYANGDIIFMDDFLDAVRNVSRTYEKFLAVGRRWDMTITKPLSFSRGWQELLKKRVKEKAILHGYSGIDYLAFPKGLFKEIPPLVVGRGGWDNWIIFDARSRKIPVIDITQATKVIHQEHDLPGTRENATRFSDDLAHRNVELAGGHGNLLTIREANFLLTRKGLQKPPFPRSMYASLALWKPWRMLLSLKRNLH